MPAADAFLSALAAGRACLHPTDTLPGLTFDPASSAGRAAVVRLKGREEGRPFLGLVPDLAAARRFWAPLPEGWEARLARLWPGPLSVVWRASSAAPASMVSPEGELGLRVPVLPEGAAWFAEALARHGGPLPTTSVNASGEPAITAWNEAVAFVAAGGGYAHDEPAPARAADALVPSTIVRLRADGTLLVLREGAMRISHIEATR